MNIRTTLCLLAVLFALVTAPFAARADDTTIRIGTIAIDAGAEPYYAVEMGFFKNAGLNVDVQSSNSGAAIVAGVVSGSIDIGFSNLTSIAVAFSKGVPVTIIAPGGLYVSSSPTTVCMVPKNSPIKTAKDLDGKTLATGTLRSIGEFGPRAWIDKNGGDSSTVKFVEMPFSSMPGAMAENRIDAIATSEPLVGPALKTGRILSNCYDGIAPRFLIGAFFTSQDWVKAHPDLARKFEGVILRTAIWANKNKSMTATMYARQAKVDPEIARTMKRSPYAERLDPREMQPLIDVSARYGVLPSSFSASSLLYRDVSR